MYIPYKGAREIGRRKGCFTLDFTYTEIADEDRWHSIYIEIRRAGGTGIQYIFLRASRGWEGCAYMYMQYKLYYQNTLHVLIHYMQYVIQYILSLRSARKRRGVVICVHNIKQYSIVYVIQFHIFSALRADEMGVIVCIDNID